MKTAPDPKDVQEFQFKQSCISQILDGFTSVPVACSLLTADRKRGLLYVAHDSKLTILKPGEDADPEWKIDLDLPSAVSKISLNCDCTYLAVTPLRPAVLIYNAETLVKNGLQLLHEIRISSTNMEAFVNDLKWNPAVPGMLCTVASDYTVGSFQMKEKSEKGIELKALEKLEGLEVLCAAWSPKGKQIVVGCKNGNIVQLKPDLKVARTIPGPTPYIGEVISLLWISNYQFCAAYLGNEQRVNVLIIDAPKREANTIFTCYEDITYGMPDAEGEGTIPRYYFNHIPEWGLIIAASSTSSEIAVLGSTDAGVTWNQWQLVDSGRAQLPLICTTESYPVGLAIDKSPTRKLPWGAESTLPNPVPILHILGTSGQLCSFHMVNLMPNCPAINSPPTEVISTPPQPQPHLQPRPSIAPSDTSIMMGSLVTSTPRAKQPENIPECPKPTPMGNIFGDSLKVAGFFQQSEEKKTKPQKQNSVVLTDTVVKVDSIKEANVPEVPKTEIKLQPAKPNVPQEVVEQKVCIDDSICVRAYLEEQNLFERELRNRLEPQTWECGTEEERKQLAERAAIIDQFLRDLRDTTNSLSSDIAYLKALLLQSFAWVEETKSKNAATIDITTRSCGDNSRIADLQRLYYYTQTQLTQATKILDLEWSEHKSQEKSRIKIPSLEFVYQNLVLHNKIIAKEKSKLEQLKKQWKKTVTCMNNISGMNRSMSNLRITSPKSRSSLRGNTGVIEARCKTIASKTLNFTQGKQIKLRQLLSDSSPKIIKPVNPSPIQDRLEATLSSLASLNSTATETKTKVEQQAATKQSNISKQTKEEAKQQSPLASLNSIVARIGSTENDSTMLQSKAQNKVPSAGVTFLPATGQKLPPSDKKPSVSLNSTIPQVKPKQDVSILFGQPNTPQTASGLPKTFPKTDSITFSTSMQKPQENIIQKSLPKEANLKNGKETSNFSSKPDTSIFSTGSLKDVLSPDLTVTKIQGSLQNNSLPSAIPTSVTTKTDAMAAFSFATPTAPTTIAKSTPQDAMLTSQATSAQTFSFASKPSTNIFGGKTLIPATQPEAQEVLDVTGLSLGSQLANQSSNNFSSDQIYYYKTTNLMSASNVHVNTVDEISIHLVYTPTSPTSSVTIEEIPAKDAKPAALPGSPMQALQQTLPQASAPSIFSSQAMTLTTSVFGGASTSAPAASAYTPSVTVSSTLPFGAQTVPSTTSVFSGFSNIATTTSALNAVTTSSTTSPFYASLTKPTFGETATTVPAPSFTGANSSPSSTLTFGGAGAATSMGSVFDKRSSSPATAATATVPAATGNQFPSTPVVSSATNAFGKPIISPSSMPFGTSSNAPLFDNMPATTNTSIFGGSNADSFFGANTPASSTTPIFGANTSPMNTFGTPSTGNIFATNDQQTGSLFGGTSNTRSTSLFGGAANSASPSAVEGSTPGSPSLFGNVGANASPMGVGVRQSMMGSQPTFGQAPTFSAKPVFGSPINMFEASKPVFGFGTPAFGANASPPAFGSLPAMGGSPPMENNMPKVFGSAAGSSTFESLASQSGGLTFSSLAQKSPEPDKAPAFTGGSSFSTWR